MNRGKNAIQNFDEGASSNPAVAEHNTKYADAQGLEQNIGNQESPANEDRIYIETNQFLEVLIEETHEEEGLEVENLKKALQHYKA